MPGREIVAGIAVLFAAAAIYPASAFGVADFRTPKRAAYCGLGHGPGVPRLVCWTPNDGFTVDMRRKSRPRKRYVDANVGFHDVVGRVLRYGRTWHEAGFRCTSRRSGLTCKNRRRHGWWLGVFHGYRLF